MEQYLTTSAFVDTHMITKYTLLETYEQNKVQLPFRVTELITSETCKTNKSDFKQKKNILPSGSFVKC